MVLKRLLIVFVFILLCYGTAGAQMELSPELEAAFGLYPGATVLQVINVEGGTTATLNCGSASMDEVFEFYKTKAQDNGFSIAMEAKQAEAFMLVLQKGQDVSGSITIGKDGDNTSAVLSLAKQ